MAQHASFLLAFHDGGGVGGVCVFSLSPGYSKASQTRYVHYISTKETFILIKGDDLCVSFLGYLLSLLFHLR